MRWYFWGAEKDKIEEDVENIHKAVRSAYDTKRHINTSWDEKKVARKKIEAYIRNTYLRAINADQNYQYKLICWLEVDS